jgi:hypothetical protein
MAIAYNTSVVRDGLVLYLDAANPKSYPGTGTTWFDLTANGNNGTINNSPIFSTTNKGYFTFDGINDNVSFSYVQPAQTTASSFTWSVWVFTTRNSFVDMIIGNRNNVLAFTKLTTKRFEYHPSNIDSDTPLDQWMNITIIKDGINFKYYRNSVLISSITSSTTKTTLPFFVGGDSTAGEYFNGRISQVLIYNRNITEDQIKINFNATRGRYGI